MRIAVRHLVVMPIGLEGARFKQERRRVCIVLEHLGRVDTVPREVEATLEVLLLVRPTVAYSWPQVFVQMEHFHERVVFDDFVYGLQSHAVQLVCCLEKGLLSVGTDFGDALLVPVGVMLARTPIEREFIVIEQIVLEQFELVVLARRDNFTGQMLVDCTILIVEACTFIRYTHLRHDNYNDEREN